MTMHNTLSPLVDDVQKQYVGHRKSGKNRAVAIDLVCKSHAQELHDPDDRLAILVGITLSLYKKKELFEPFATETLCEIQRAFQTSPRDNETSSYLEEVENCLKDESAYGNEAFYKRASSYLPDWQIGDMFSHPLTHPAAEELGIKGWFILLYKVGDFVDEFDVHRQLMFVSLCPSDKIPSCNSDVQQLPFLRMMQLGDKSEYLAQITIKSKKDENAYGLTKIGYYPNISYPNDYVDENPLTSMPLLGRVRRDSPCPSYEDQICRLYRKYGRLP